jgi:prophage antirepressor-like protein
MPKTVELSSWLFEVVIPEVLSTGSYNNHQKTAHEQQKLERIAHIKMTSINELKRKHEDSLQKQTLLRHYEDVRAAVADDERRREMMLVAQQNSQMLNIIQTKDDHCNSIVIKLAYCKSHIPADVSKANNIECHGEIPLSSSI